MTRRARKPQPGEPLASPPADGRHRVMLVAPGASPAEAAAVVAALERFLAETAPPAPAPSPPPPSLSRWLRAALREGISRGDRRRGSWGDPHP